MRILFNVPLTTDPFLCLDQVGVHIGLCPDSSHLHSHALCAATHTDVRSQLARRPLLRQGRSRGRDATRPGGGHDCLS